ncbi:ABC transporter permease [Prolixibacter denitrificans]|uniref:ABC transporter permease n=1 Tax=Prolixibacter denitrificans TaxID=1541063 RepID=A0A2P8C813_9BACT|nr:ABC transporter permease [Prolixibacter denitrificans]PSK81101.1 ABC-type multidrug transport system permease subunit [Prolixibacter denitrificans]GET22218.1 ABC transporter permease [Prolixibacter denitrificans]
MNNRLSNHQLWQLTLSYSRELLREPGVLFWGIVFPILMSLGLGIAFTQKTDVVRKVAVIDASVDSTSIQHFLLTEAQANPEVAADSFRYSYTIPDKQMGNTTFLFRETDWKEAMVLLKRGQINVILTEQNGKPEYHFDPRNPDAQLTYIKLSGMLNGKVVNTPQDNGEIKPLTLAGTRYIDFLVPGLIAMNAMMSCMWGISYGIIDRRSKKLLRRMVATPMKKTNFLIAFITVRFVMNFIESALLVLVTWLVFGITIQGSIPGLLAIFMAGNLAFAGIAIFVSSHTANTEVGNGLINLVVMPMMVLSGIFFSYHNFPDWSIPVIQKLPLTMLADGIRGIFNEGLGMTDIALPFVILSAIGVFFFSLGLRFFKWH